MNNTELSICPMKTRYWHERTYKFTKWLAGSSTIDVGAWALIGADIYYTGVTMCIIEQGGKYAVGISKCSKKDQFNKKIARTISYGRAIKALNEGVLYLPASEKLVGAGWITDKIRLLLPEQAEQLI